MQEPSTTAQPSVNAFAHTTAALRYAQGRPYYHPVVVSRIGQSLGCSGLLERALDVGCGTGQSSQALLALAGTVVGVDASPAMLAHGSHDPRLTFHVAPAESLPFPDQTFDLITVAAAFHWFDRAPFLAEAARVLKPNAWLVLYDNAFLGTREDNPDFAAWIREAYGVRFPAPPRDRRSLTAAEAIAHGLELVQSENYTNTVDFTLPELVDYLLTQSNTIAAIEGNGEAVDEVTTWLESEVMRLLPCRKSSFRFGGTITYLQRR